MANRALDSLHQALIEILRREEDDLITGYVKKQIISIHDAAVYLQLNLKHFPDEETLREVAYTAEEIIEYVFSPENLSNCESIVPAVRFWKQLKELAKEVESTAGDVVDYISSSTSDEERLTLPMVLAARISNRFGRLLEKIKSTVSDDQDPSSTELAVVVGNSSSTSALMTQDDDVAGFDRQYFNVSAGVGSSSRSAPTSKHVHLFEEDLVRILDQLVSRSTERHILSIVGMGGSGKSSLAKTVYDDVLTKQHFDVCVWITLSQDSSVESIVSGLLAAFKGETVLVRRDSLYQIHRHLRGRRYLVVMDDVWSLQLLDDIMVAFPNDGTKSRIVLTTRLLDVASGIGNSIHTMRLLDEQESWDLFERQVFADDQSCPPELQPVAKKIVQGCGGLPLSIVKVASLLYKIDKNPKLWQKIVANDGKLGTTSSLSYNHLPRHLRSCFLYMAAFPGDYEIHASELIRLWIAEGFLDCLDESKSLEQVGEAYLEDLVKKNLVLVISKKQIDGSIQKCKLHSTVRDFCVRQAERVKFLLPVMDYLPTPILRRHFLPQVLENHRRISASWYDLDLKDSMHSSCTKTIICIPQRGYRPRVSVRNFTSVRVLHVLHRDDDSYWELGEVFDLIHLTYLASNIPTSIAISNLQNLQTLIIYRHEVRLPVEIWRLRQLRHLIAFSFRSLPHPEEEAFPLIHLQTLCLATDFVCSAKMVEMIPNIRKLGICYYKEILDEGYCLDNISHLIQLEKLKLERRTLIWLSPNPHHFPQSLKKLTLSGWRLPWSDMMIVGSLPNLQVLKLRNYACDGECWETTEEGFQSLKLLLIDESNLQHWITESSHFPVLRCLMLHRCPYLHEIPDDFVDILTLELIEIDASHQSLLYSAKRIQEDQQIEWEHDYLQVQAVRL